MNTKKEFFTHVQKTPTCWLWMLSLRDNGYGQLRWRGRIRYAHHVAWELEYGPIPEGKHILHRCDTKHCVRFDDLYAGTQGDNSEDFMTREWHKHNTHKLTPDDVRQIRQLYSQLCQHRGTKWGVIAEIARQYPQVESKAIRRIIHNGYWRTVQ